MVPHHCLGSVWSRRDKKRVDAPSVYATVNQFNAVSYRVIATVLKRPDVKRIERAKIIEKWINIAQVSLIHWSRQYLFREGTMIASTSTLRNKFD